MKKNTIITCGKFDNNIFFNSKFMQRKKIRIGSKNPNLLKNKIYEPISTNGQTILYRDKMYNARDFLCNANKVVLQNLIVLTIKERELILEELVDFNLDINVFELKYPIFSHVRYISNLHKNYEELVFLINKINILNIEGESLANQLSTKYLFQVERKLRFKTTLDSYFAFAYKGGYQEVFKLKEERKDRVVIAMDFNSMYVDCMMNKFIEPKSIRYINLRNSSNNIEALDDGLYRVVLKNCKNTFFREYHPFKFSLLNKSYYFHINNEEDIEVLLFKSELLYYQKFFYKYEILEGFCTNKSINHPLKQYAVDTYNDRLRYKREGNNVLANLAKYKLITIHSATNSKRFKTLYFKNISSILKYISATYMIKFSTNMSEIEQIESIQDDNYFKFWTYKNGYKIKVINFDTHESVYSISSQIIANGRMKMLQTIELFLKHNSVEICYSNIDSIHISIAKKEVDSFLKKHHHMISDKLGDLKIESISEKGYWFDIGRYWLFSENKIDIFKNSIFNQKNLNNEFIKNKKINIVYKNNTMNYIKTRWVNIYKSFSYHKKIEIDKYNYIRYNYEEIRNLDVARLSYSQEILSNKKLKVDLFDKIATV